MDDDDGYSNRIALAVYEAVITASKGDADVSVIRSGSAFDGVMNVAALLIANNPELKNAHDIRAFCDNVSKSLRRRINEVRASPEAARAFGEVFDPSRIN